MRVDCRPLLPLALIQCAAASAARADFRAWSLCTPGALRSCHSVSIGTLPVFTGTTRTGTAITISLTNLGGSGLPDTGSGATGLYQVYFTGPITTPIAISVVDQQPATLTGAGASGSLTWQRITLNATVGGTFAWVELRGLGTTPPLLGGCTSGPTKFGTIAAQTCGPGAAAVFAFSINGLLDASQLDNVWVLAYGDRGGEGCYSNTAASPFFGQACDLLSDPLAPTPIPEPGIIILLGTGLLGVGGTSLRRRRTSPPPRPPLR